MLCGQNRFERQPWKGNPLNDLARRLSHKEAGAASGSREGLWSMRGRERERDGMQVEEWVLTMQT